MTVENKENEELVSSIEDIRRLVAEIRSEALMVLEEFEQIKNDRINRNRNVH